MHTSRSGHTRNFHAASKWFALCALALACAPPLVVREGWDADQGPAALLAASASLAEFADLTAEAAIELRRGKVRDRGTALVQLVNPDLFRVEVRGPFFTHIFTALLKGDSLTVYGRGMDLPLKGPVRGQLLTTLTGLDFGTCDLRYALLGLVEPGSIVEPVEYPRADHAVVALADGRRAWLDLHRGLVLRESIPLPIGDVLLRELSEYRRVDALYLPRRVEIRQADVALVLYYKRYAFNSGLNASQLQQGLPAGVMRGP
ncbi:MAG: hypothetical protein OXE49_01090 [Gemmatimonadetes bacterium]|nr:hypothetical protein [Gemmatimonadota bacterium]